MGIWDRVAADRLLADVSLWSADLAQLGVEMRRVEPVADLFHIDVADAHFVPGLLFFPDLVAALRPLTAKPLHVHLMADNPRPLIDAFVAAGADLLTIHVENGPLVPDALRQIKQHGRAAGLAVDLDTPPDALESYLGQIDLVLMMGTKLGIKGEDLDPTACDRIHAVRALLQQHGYHGAIKIGADGGIRAHTVLALRAAGADLIVPGSLVFNSPDLAATTAWLRSLPHPLPV